MDITSSRGLSRRGLLRAATTTAAAARLRGPSLQAGARRPGAAHHDRGRLVEGFRRQDLRHALRQGEQFEIVWKLGLSMEPIIMAQQRRPQWDLVHTSQTHAEQLGSMGLYRAWKPRTIPNLAKIHPVLPLRASGRQDPHALWAVRQHQADQARRSLRGRTCGTPPSRARSPSRPGTGSATRSSRRSTSRSAAPPTTSIPASRKVQGRCSRTTGARSSTTSSTPSSCCSPGKSGSARYFGARTEQAAAAGAPVEFVHPEGGRAQLDLQHGDHREPPAGIDRARREIREHDARRREADRLRAADRLSADQYRSDEEPAARSQEARD